MEVGWLVFPAVFIQWLARYWAEIAALLSVSMALLVTGHVVLHKRDAGGAAAWTGLVWLLPVLGAILYLLLGINRIQRRAQALVSELPPVSIVPPAVQPKPSEAYLHSMSELVGRVTGLPLTAGNEVVCLEAAPAMHQMLEEIHNARESVYMVTYIFGNDIAGRPLIEALAAAVRRGVRVRVLIDGMGSLYSFPTVIRRMRQEGIVVERFLYSLAPWRMPYMNLRNHRKIMVIDQERGFTGGMNIRKGYVSVPPVIRDLHLRVEGPVVGHLLKSFCIDWYFSSGERLDDSYPGSDVGMGSTQARGISAGPDADFGNLRTTLLVAIGTAQHDIRIATPYFVPDQTLLTALQVACMRGVRVQLMMPAHSNLPIVQWASTHTLLWLAEEGCEIYLSPAPFDHSKLMTIDGHWALLGSSNWDARSLRLNFEFDLECYDPDLVTSVNGFFELRRANARRLSLSDLQLQPLWWRLRNALAHVLEPYL